MSATGTANDRPLDVVAAYAHALGHEGHVLVEHPELTFQQLHNRLQWEGEAVVRRLAPQRERRSDPGARPWLRTRTRLRESEALVRTLAGHTGGVRTGQRHEVLGCAFSPDGTRLVSASRDKTLELWDAAVPGRPAPRSGAPGDTPAPMGPDGDPMPGLRPCSFASAWGSLRSRTRWGMRMATDEAPRGLGHSSRAAQFLLEVLTSVQAVA